MIKIGSIRPSDLLHLALNSLKRNKLRTFLTIGAISFGIAVMMYLISMGMGLERMTLGNVEQSKQLLTMTLRPIGSDTLNPIDPKTVSKLSKIAHIKEVLPKIGAKGEMVLDNSRAPATVSGVDPSFFDASDTTKITTGRSFQKDSTGSVVVTNGFLKLFGLSVDKVPLVVFSLNFDKTDYPNAVSMENLNVDGVINDQTAAIVYVPRAALEKALNLTTIHYDQASITVDSADNIEAVQNSIISYGFRVEAVVDTVAEIKNAFYWIRFILATLGLTAIFVASIGMFNTLTISLLERTREIAIMKAIGVKKSDITRLFMSESIMIGIFGGVFGVLLAIFLQQITIFALSLLASFVQGNVPALFYNQIWVVIGFLVFSLLISIITGIYPARRATHINPIEAIRYE